jgi:hypothetical protein
MKRPRWFLRIAAVVCSVLLLAGFVSYRAGAFNWLRPGTTSLMPGSKRDQTPIHITPTEPTFLPGSKSDRIEIAPSESPKLTKPPE